MHCAKASGDLVHEVEDIRGGETGKHEAEFAAGTRPYGAGSTFAAQYC